MKKEKKITMVVGFDIFNRVILKNLGSDCYCKNRISQ